MMVERKVTRDTLNAAMGFDHVVMVGVNGTVTDFPDVYAPDLYDGQLSDSEWSFFTNGYSGQSGYSGPIMHASEYVGGKLADDILSTPGVYAVIASYDSPEDDGGDSIVEGWAVVRYRRAMVVEMLSVCTDCIHVLANGECDPERPADLPEPLSLVPDGYNLVPGGDHLESCTQADRDAGCECESYGFSTSACEGCGDVHHGDRFAATLFLN